MRWVVVVVCVFVLEKTCHTRHFIWDFSFIKVDLGWTPTYILFCPFSYAFLFTWKVISNSKEVALSHSYILDIAECKVIMHKLAHRGCFQDVRKLPFRNHLPTSGLYEKQSCDIPWDTCRLNCRNLASLKIGFPPSSIESQRPLLGTGWEFTFPSTSVLSPGPSHIPVTGFHNPS